MTSAFGSCTVIWMQPGSYYFDWGVADAANTQWSITDTLIGGTPLGWNPAGGSTPSITVPGACDTASAGVHIVFATTSRLDIGGKAEIELCGPVSATSQRVVALRAQEQCAGHPAVAADLQAHRGRGVESGRDHDPVRQRRADQRSLEHGDHLGEERRRHGAS